MSKINVTFNTYLHEYAIWTAARAAQRGFTTTAEIRKAIEATSLQADCNDAGIKWSEEHFDAKHKEWANIMMEQLKAKDCSYGRAAKIIAIYIKTAVILPNKGEGELASVAHPPIDRILQMELKKAGYLKQILSWTSLDESDYMHLIKKLRGYSEFKPFWQVEKYWRGSEAEE
jgi:hypothetical protein